MFGQGMKKILNEDVKKLSFSQQKKLHDYARAMIVSRQIENKGSDLLKFSGMFDKKSIKEMKEAIESGCERIDHSDW
jgi:hypothetical protein